MSVSRYVRTSTKSLCNFNEIWCVDRGGRTMHDGMPYDPIQGQGQGQGEGLLKFRKLHLSRSISFTVYNGSWQMTTDS